MGFMDQALSEYKAPTGEDLDISLPPRREPRQEASDLPSAGEPVVGQHGGGAENSAGTEHSDVAGAGTAAAEPTPQRDEPDEGEHTDSTEEQVAARVRHEDLDASTDHVEATESDVEPEMELEPAEETPEGLLLSSVRTEPPSMKEVLSKTEGTSPLTFKRVGFSAGKDASGEDVPAVTVTRFPQPLVEKLRLMLAPSAGGEFAEAIAAPALITAFLVAKTGVELDLDENTAAAAEAFRGSDPRLSIVEDRLEQVNENVVQLARAMKLSLDRIADTGNVVDTMEYGLAFLVADRVAGLTTTDTNETNVDVTQPKVVTARATIRGKAKAHRTIEKQREGRRLA